jgi:hypothetical protein
LIETKGDEAMRALRGETKAVLTSWLAVDEAIHLHAPPNLQRCIKRHIVLAIMQNKNKKLESSKRLFVRTKQSKANQSNAMQRNRTVSSGYTNVCPMAPASAPQAKRVGMRRSPGLTADFGSRGSCVVGLWQSIGISLA